MENLEDIRKKMGTASELNAVVRTMKAIAAAHVGQYERAVEALTEYYRTVSLGLVACFRQPTFSLMEGSTSKKPHRLTLLFGTDQGLVGTFNQELVQYALSETLQVKEKRFWTIGERVKDLLADAQCLSAASYALPSTMESLGSLVDLLLEDIEKALEEDPSLEIVLAHHSPQKGNAYGPVLVACWPLDTSWKAQWEVQTWPSRQRPQLLGETKKTYVGLVKEYLFLVLYKACAESLACENKSRLMAMQRAEKKIEEAVQELTSTYHQIRQTTIDEELFDVVAGFEALKK